MNGVVGRIGARAGGYAGEISSGRGGLASHHMDDPGKPANLERKGKPMRATMIAMLATATIGLAGTSHTQAAPASGGVIGATVTGESLVQQAQFSRTRVIRDCVHRGFSRRVCRTIRRHR
jgi:hypothetical protein